MYPFPALSALYLRKLVNIFQLASPIVLARQWLAIIPFTCKSSTAMTWFSSTIRRESLCEKSLRAQASKDLHVILHAYLPGKDSDLDSQTQILMCYHYTTGQMPARPSPAKDGGFRRLLAKRGRLQNSRVLPPTSLLRFARHVRWDFAI